MWSEWLAALEMLELICKAMTSQCRLHGSDSDAVLTQHLSYPGSSKAALSCSNAYEIALRKSSKLPSVLRCKDRLIISTWAMITKSVAYLRKFLEPEINRPGQTAPGRLASALGSRCSCFKQM